MADTEVLRAIEIIDRKIQSLQNARNQLAHAFGVDSSPLTGMEPTEATLAAVKPRIHAPTFGPVQQKPRKEALAEFLRANGPTSRGEIVLKAGLPEGTVSYCLNDKRFFVQLENGDWDVTPVLQAWTGHEGARAC